MNNLKLKDRLNTKVQDVEERTANTNEAAFVPTNNYIALKSNALEIIKENLKNQPLSFQLFDIVKSPSGGSTVFSVPGLSGDEAAKRAYRNNSRLHNAASLLGYARSCRGNAARLP